MSESIHINITSSRPALGANSLLPSDKTPVDKVSSFAIHLQHLDSVLDRPLPDEKTPSAVHVRPTAPT